MATMALRACFRGHFCSRYQLLKHCHDVSSWSYAATNSELSRGFSTPGSYQRSPSSRMHIACSRSWFRSAQWFSTVQGGSGEDEEVSVVQDVSEGDSEFEVGDGEGAQKPSPRFSNPVEQAAHIGYKVVGRVEPGDFTAYKAPNAFAVVQVGSHQFKISPGDCIYTEKLKFADVNDKLSLEKVLLLGSKSQTIIGRPLVPKAFVHAAVEEQVLDAKVIVFKKKRRKNYRRCNGHRQELTRLRILEIWGLGEARSAFAALQNSKLLTAPMLSSQSYSTLAGRQTLSSNIVLSSRGQFYSTIARDISITDNCVSRLHDILKEEGSTSNEKMLRVSVEGGGCSGFQYVFSLETKPDNDDRIFEKDGVKIIIDNISMGFLKGATIDYVEELIRASFMVTNNPNASGGCGCGSSFVAK